MEAEDKAWMDEAGRSQRGAVVGGRATYEAVVTGATKPSGTYRSSSSRTARRSSRRVMPSPSSAGWRRRSRGPVAAGGKNVHVMGGADVLRQALEQGLVDRLSIIIAPVILGGGKRLFDGFASDIELEHLAAVAVRHVHRLPGREAVTALPRLAAPAARALAADGLTTLEDVVAAWTRTWRARTAWDRVPLPCSTRPSPRPASARRSRPAAPVVRQFVIGQICPMGNE